VTAQVRQNVYDTVTGRYLLIPQGSKLIIVYDSQVAYGQSRVLPAVKRVIFPNGQSMDLEGMPGEDISGYAGFKDRVNNHYGKIYGAAIATGAIAALFQLSQPQQSSVFVNPTSTQIVASSMGQQLAQAASVTIGKGANIQPTLEIRPGYEFNVNVTADMIFPQPYV
jgi:type IV secretion system protein VirB10